MGGLDRRFGVGIWVCWLGFGGTAAAAALWCVHAEGGVAVYAGTRRCMALHVMPDMDQGTPRIREWDGKMLLRSVEERATAVQAKCLRLPGA